MDYSDTDELENDSEGNLHEIEIINQTELNN